MRWAQKAGPGMLMSFVIAGFVCGVAALCYSELASMVPVAGSAYTYTYAVVGEMMAWMVGWALILEYAVGAEGRAGHADVLRHRRLCLRRRRPVLFRTGFDGAGGGLGLHLHLCRGRRNDGLDGGLGTDPGICGGRRRPGRAC